MGTDLQDKRGTRLPTDSAPTTFRQQREAERMAAQTLTLSDKSVRRTRMPLGYRQTIDLPQYRGHSSPFCNRLRRMGGVVGVAGSLRRRAFFLFSRGRSFCSRRVPLLSDGRVGRLRRPFFVVRRVHRWRRVDLRVWYAVRLACLWYESSVEDRCLLSPRSRGFILFSEHNRPIVILAITLSTRVVFLSTRVVFPATRVVFHPPGSFF